MTDLAAQSPAPPLSAVAASASPGMGKTARPPLPVLTSLRYFAAAEVVIFHFFFFRETDFLRALFSAGPQAVIFFFVLSGFILAYVYSGAEADDLSPTPPREFWKARVARIMPAYVLGLLIAFPAFAYAALVSKILPLGPFLLALVMVPLLLQAWWPPVVGAWNGPAWSLSVEAVFYALFPLLLRITRRIKPMILLAISFGLLVAVQAVRQQFHPVEPAPEEAWQFYKYFPPFHVTTFLFGLALGRVFLFSRKLPQWGSALMCCLGMIATVLVLGFRYRLAWLLSTDTVLVLLFGMVVLGGAGAGRVLKPLAHPIMVLLGEASYAMYILHMPLMFWWVWVSRNKLHLNLPWYLDVGLFLVTITLVSILTLQYVERPLRRRILGHRSHRAA